jgi:signal transduction histidine kinase
MKHPKILIPLALVFMMTGGVASAGEFGTRDQAKAMLDRAVAVLKADKDRALDLFTSGDGGFKDRDLYVFCGGPDGMLTAHPYVMGINLKGFTDKAGKKSGEEIYAVAAEDDFAEVTYKWVRPGEDEHVDKVSFVTRVGDQVCGVGYYAQ